MILNKLNKDMAFNSTISTIENIYKSELEDIFVNILIAIDDGKFYLRYYVTDESQVHSLEYYLKANNFQCGSNYNFCIDDKNEVINDKDGNPIKDKIWLDIWWNK